MQGLKYPTCEECIYSYCSTGGGSGKWYCQREAYSEEFLHTVADDDSWCGEWCGYIDAHMMGDLAEWLWEHNKRDKKEED